MSEPTNYDMLQDGRIDEIERVVTVGDNPTEGKEYSFPIPDYPLNQEQFQLLSLANGNGIIDRGDYPYWLRPWESDSETNAKNSMVLSIGGQGQAEAIVSGYYHVLTEDREIPLPPVTTETTYRICLTYDPRSDKDRLGPISVQVYTTEPPTTFARINVVLHTVTRKPNQLLTDAVVERFRPRTVAPIAVLKRAHLPSAANVLYGAVGILYGDNDIVVARGASSDEGGPTRWDSLLSPDFYEPGDTDTYKWPGHGFKRGIQRMGKKRIMRGRIARASGENFNTNNSSGYQLWALSAEDTPEHACSFITTGSGYTSPKYSRIEVNGKDAEAGSRGLVRVYVAENTSWVSLDGVSWDVE